MNLNDITSHLSTARTEYQSNTPSVYGSFVAPFFLPQHNLLNIAHSVSLEGGRGCGKTMYVRYFSHWTQFDPNRNDVSKENLSTIILYWKPDTAYCRGMSKSWLSEKNANQFFLTLMSLELLKEFTSSISNIGYHFEKIIKNIEESEQFWSAIKDITQTDIHSFVELNNWITTNLFIVQSSINSNDISRVVNIDPKAMFAMLVPIVKSCSELISQTKIKIFVDEFENLADYQQQLINNYRKHSDSNLIWNVAHKSLANISTQTSGDEQLQDPDDYRAIRLDKLYFDVNKSMSEEYELLSSEILILSLQRAGLECNVKLLSPVIIGEEKSIGMRQETQYKNEIFEITKKILPNPSEKELARIALEDTSALKVIKNRFKEISGYSQKDINNLVEQNPEIIVTAWAVYNQKNFSIADIESYIDASLKSKHPFYDKIHTYLYASLLKLNSRSVNTNIPVYAGFNRFCTISKGNIRHFMELCYHSLVQKAYEYKDDISSVNEFPEIDYVCMQRGAISASEHAVKEIPTFNPYGMKLSSIVKRLGDLFSLAQAGENQSEPEKNHFYIDAHYGAITDEIDEIIQAAKSWKVFIEYHGTKDKKPNSSALTEYQLNPIYAPKYGITYRKKRRLVFTIKEFNTICFGEAIEYQQLRDKIVSTYDVEEEQKQGRLNI